MLQTTVSRRLAAIVAAVLTALAVVAGPVAPQADAQQRNLVIFGDSIIANPNAPQYFAGGSSNGTLGSSGNPQAGCPQGSHSWGRGAAARLGLTPYDYSCSGTVSVSQGPQFSAQVDRALRTRGLHAGTQRVIISTGFNDTYNNRHLSSGQLQNKFVHAMAPQINRIKAAAPNARIQIVGYPSLTEGNNVCLFHVGPNVYDRTPFPDANRWQWQAQNMQRALAHTTGVEFLDMKPSTADNHMCAPDHKRMWAGLVDFYSGSGNLPIHVNDRGHNHVAGVIARS